MDNSKIPSKILNHIYNLYNKDAGKMLRHTGVIGWIMSSAAQIGAIIMNDELSKEQKMFLVPQEFADACVNILSFYLITSSFTSAGEKLVTTGKWLPSNVKKQIIKNGFKDKIGNFDFDILRDAKITGTPKKSFNRFKNGISVISTIIGSVISCNIITPILRNLYASHRQQTNIARFNNPNPALQNPQTNRDKARAAIHKTYMQAFMNRENLKI